MATRLKSFSLAVPEARRKGKAMSDRHMGGLLAFVIAAPVMVICCGGGGVILTAILGGLSGWLSGLGWIATVIAAVGAMLVFREFQRRRPAHADSAPEDTCCRHDAQASLDSAENANRQQSGRTS